MAIRDVTLFEWGILIGSVPFLLVSGILYGLIMTTSMLYDGATLVERIWVKLKTPGTSRRHNDDH